MASISTTTLEQLEPLVIAKILTVSPRIRVQGGNRWKHYEKSRASPGRTRSFTLRWVPGQFVPGGYFTTPGRGGVETATTLLVRADYAGSHERLMWLVHDDYQQLRDVISQLTADITSGLVSFLPSATGTALVADTTQGRQRLTDRPATSSDNFQIDHTFDATFMQARA